jgi:biopolymer transport protein ExbD
MAIGTPHSGAEADADLDPADDTGSIFADINITPLTDVILVLLIIVMLYANAEQHARQRDRETVDAQQRSGLKVNLPDGAAKEIEPGASSLVVGILANGDIFVNGQKVAEADLGTIFQNKFAENKDTLVVIKADGEAAHRRVVKVMERAKGVGLRRIAIATRAGGG